MLLISCNSISLIRTIMIIKGLVSVLQAVIPICLIVQGMVHYYRVLIKRKKLKKPTIRIVFIIVSSCILFYMPTVFDGILHLIKAPDNTLIACYNKANYDTLDELVIKRSKQELKAFEEKLDFISYTKAHFDIITIHDSNSKNELLTKLNSLENYMYLNNKINKVKNKCSYTDYNNLLDEINDITKVNIHTKLLNNLENRCKIQDLEIEAGTYSYNHELNYYVNVPNNATTKMPLVMYLYGDYSTDYTAMNNPFYTNAKEIYGDDFPFIVVAPSGGMWAETPGRIEVLHDIILEACENYSCDEDRIIITGHSRGAIGTWTLANKYPDMFYAAVPVSCYGDIDGKNYKNIKTRAYCGNRESDLIYYHEVMEENVNKIKEAGGDAEFIEIDSGHGRSPYVAYDEDLYKWLFEED